MSGKRMVASHERHVTWITYALLAGLWLVHSGVHLLWLRIDTRPPFWDMANHARTALHIGKMLLLLNIPAALTASSYPPLVYVASLPFALLFGLTSDGLTSVNVLFLGIIILSTYHIGYAFGGRKVGLLAAFIASMYPIIYGLARHYLLDVPLVAMVTLATWLLIRTNSFERRGATVIYGLSLGLGMLTKWSFAVFATGPFLITAINILIKHSWRRLLNMALAVGVAILVAIPWYLINLRALMDFRRLQGAYALLEGDAAMSAQESWLYYLNALVNHQVLVPFALLFAGGLISLLTTRKFGYKIALLLSWIVLPYLVFSMYSNKDVRFTIPYLPAMAVITALGMIQLRPLQLRIGLMALLGLYAGLQFAGLSWRLSNRLPVDLLPPRILAQVGPTHLLLYAEEGVHIASPPQSENWQAQAILQDIMGSRKVARSTDPLVLTVLPNAPCFEPSVFAYYVMIKHLPIHTFGTTGAVSIKDARAQILTSDYVVAKTNDQGPKWSLQESVSLTDEIRDATSELGSQFKRIGIYNLPDGSVGELYQHMAAPAN
jgi:4-amino-4-deoxy-L-arabinose transferase-like glycosyltransferase